MLTSEYLEDLIRRKVQGESFSSIRKELENRNLDENKIKEVLKYIDNNVLHYEIKKSSKTKQKELKAIGFILLTFGLVLTLGSLFNLFNIGNYMIIAYGPILGGIGILGFGYGIKR